MNFVIASILVALSVLSLSTSLPDNFFHKSHRSDDAKSNFHLKWITHQTKFPLVLEVSHPDASVSEYDWFKYDQNKYVTSLDTYRPNYFVSMEGFKSELTLFNYDALTHEQLTTYEPQPTIESTHPDKLNEMADDFFTLIYLKSHRIRIDRDQNNKAANVTCIADFLVDQNSIKIDKHLVDQMKHLALFKINMNEPTRADFKEFTRRIRRKNEWERSSLAKNWLAKKHERVARAAGEQDWTPNKMIMNVRLSFGPIQVVQPFRERLVSCNLDLVSADYVNLDFQNKIYKFLSREDIGLDKNPEDFTATTVPTETTTFMSMSSESNLFNQTFTSDVTSTTVETTTTTTTTTTETTTTTHKPVNQLDDKQLNELFKKELILEKMEKKLIHDNPPTTELQLDSLEMNLKKLSDEKLNHTEKEQAHFRRMVDEYHDYMIKKINKGAFDFEHLNRELNIAHDRTMMFMIDKPKQLHVGDLSAATGRHLNLGLLVFTVLFISIFNY